jgi:hypothetical protein
MGWNQPTYVRGSQSFFTGFEYDGIPVNRAFDNYNSSTESNLGLQELQVYTGGGPSSNSSSGTAGFINQVIKTGTYPGSGTLGAGIGGPTFYHQLKVEAGGATPDRNFSYYVGLSGYNQENRFLNNSNGANLMNPGGIYGLYSTAPVFALGDIPTCDGTGAPSFTTPQPWLGGTGCLVQYAGYYGQQSSISDRENIVNFHFAIPRKNGLRDDIQLLYSSSALLSTFYSSVNDTGGANQFMLSVAGAPYVAPNGTANDCAKGDACFPAYVDAVVYNAPFGTPVSGLTTQNYFQPSSPQDRAFGAALPNNVRDSIYNDTGIVKLQYTHALSSSAYVRAFAYTFFSDWTQAGAVSSVTSYQYGIGGPTDAVAANYDLITHTAGGEVQFADQLNAKNLLQFTGNYTTANVVRYNNTGFTGGASPIGIVSSSNGAFTCWNEKPTSSNFDQPVSCSPKQGAAQVSTGYTSNAAAGPYNNGVLGPNATAAGAQWVTLWNGDSSGTYNTVKPKMSFLSLTDEFRPNDKFLLDLGMRYENYTYDMPSQASVATQFYANIVQKDVCVNSVGTTLTTPLLPGQPPPAPIIYEPQCPNGYSHPAFSANSPSTYSLNYWSPRVSATYTQSPDTVWRASAGRFTEPPISASVQYLNTSGNALNVWTATLPLGFNSPFHPIPSMSAAQYDFSLERHIRGTDVSFKLSPFYNYTKGYQEQSFLGPNFVTQAPVGNFKSVGVEGSITKGDFSRDGLSGQVSLTYTDAKVQYQNYFGTNQVNSVNTAISQFNKLTQAGGGAKCYTPSTTDANGNLVPGSGTSCGGATDILNPYYGMSPQGTLDLNAWYPAGDLGLSPSGNTTTTYFDSPWVGSLILNYRKNKFAITPSVQIAQGSSYGGPLDVVGYDPRTCGQNSAAAGVTAVSPSTNPQQCDYLSTAGTVSTAAGQLFIPNPQTGSFATIGAFRNPWLLTGNVALSYDISPRVSAQLTLANVFHTCFGGTKAAWTNAFAPGPNICGYLSNGLYTSNMYEGTSATDRAANGFQPYPFQLQSYSPTNGNDAGFIPSPFNAYFQVQIKL